MREGYTSRVANEKRDQEIAQAKQQQLREEKAIAFRKNLQPGDVSMQGLVLAVNGKLVKVQALDSVCTKVWANNSCAHYEQVTSEKWLQRSELQPPYRP